METIIIKKEEQALQFAASKDKTRYNLLGVYSNGTHLMATNGHILAIRKKSTELPTNTLITFKSGKLKEDTEAYSHFDGQFIGKSNLANIATVEKDISYPDVNLVFKDAESKDYKNTITFDFAKLQALVSALALNSKDIQSVTLQSTGEPLDAILVGSEESDTVGVLMPLKADEPLNVKEKIKAVLAE